LADTSSGNLTITMPDATTLNGRTYMIKKISSSNNLIISGLIDGNYAVVMAADSRGSMELMSNGVKWLIMSMSSSGVSELDLWTPSDFTTALWLDASDSTTVLAGSSDNVYQWSDKSGDSNHVTQDTASAQPLTDSKTIGGNNTIYFDGSNEMSTATNFFGANIVDAHIFIVQKLDTVLATNQVGFSLSGSATDANRWQSHSPLENGTVYLDCGGNSGGARISTGSWGVINEEMIASFNCSVTDSVQEIWKNGYKSQNNSSGQTVATAGNIFIGSGVSASFMRAQYGEVIVINGTLSTDTRQKTEGYLAWKWGLMAKLPQDHPYRWDGTIFGYRVLWQPSSITSTLWLDAADTSTVLAVSDNVYQWSDKSGNDYHAVQATNVSQPITDSRTLYGLNVLDFDGSNDDLSIVAGPQADSAQTIMIAVADFDSPLDTDGQRLVNFQVGTGSRWALRLEDELIAEYNNAASFTGPNQTVTAGARLISGYRDGTTVGVGVDGVYSTDTSGGNVTLDTWKIGSYNSTGDYLNGKFAEAVVLKNYSLDTLQKLEGYLAWKWGLEANLPIGHPYKNAAP
jgi:hypothetical protein